MKDRFVYESEHCTLIDTTTNMHYDACGIVYDLRESKLDLEEKNEQLKTENERLCNFNLHNILDKKNKEIEQLKSVNQELENENEILKGKLWNCQNVR